MQNIKIEIIEIPGEDPRAGFWIEGKGFGVTLESPNAPAREFLVTGEAIGDAYCMGFAAAVLIMAERRAAELAENGRKGGLARSDRKRETATANGRKGGRPRSDNPTPRALAKRRSRARQTAKRREK